MRNLLAVLAFATLLSATGAAQELPFPGSEPVRRLWNIQLELLRAKGGLGFNTYGDYYPRQESTYLGLGLEARLVSASAEYRRFRAGTSLVVGLAGLGLQDGWFPLSFALFPVRVGYTLFQRPLEYEESGVFQGMLPDVFAEVELYWLEQNFRPAWKGGVCAEADNRGGGVGAEVAVFYGPGPRLVPVASVYLRLATNLGF